MGIILFALLSGKMPHTGETPELKKLINENVNLYWIKIQNMSKIKFTKDFKDIFMGMINRDVKKRFRIEDIKNNTWFNGETYTDEEYYAQMKNIYENNNIDNKK